MIKSCEMCGKEFEAQRSTGKYCSAACRGHNHTVTKKRIDIPKDLRFYILHRDGFQCRYCGARPPKKELRVDHVQSLKDGGLRTASENLVTTCFDCNAGKGELSVAIELVPPPGGEDA